MKHLILVGMALAATMAAPAQSQSVDGTWRVDLATVQLPTRPMEWRIQNGTYACVSCPRPWSVTADGQFHSVANQPYFDEAAVLLADQRNVVITFRHNGRMTSTMTYNVMQDGRTHSAAWRDINVSGLITSGEGTGERLTAGPEGTHSLSGTWRQRQVANMSEDALRVTFRSEGDVLHVSYPTGESYSARFGGPAVAIRGDAAGSQVSLRRLGVTGMEETTMRDGRPVGILTMTFADAATINVVQRNALTGTETRYAMRRE